MEQRVVKPEDLFTLEEAAKVIGISKGALYQHYYRGHLQRYPAEAHRLYFSRDVLKDFCNKYIFTLNSLF